jgi:XTP/dITP diphosphohydrolase
MAVELIFATNNKHKLEEISKLLLNKVKILSLKDVGCFDDIPEEGQTFEENALQKARYIFDKYKANCFADDSGLEVLALNGKPGVHSARYSISELPEADEKTRSEANIKKLLNDLRGIKRREAVFRTVICFIKNGREFFFEGKISGQITTEKRGSQGFGYDPVFVPDGYNKTFAEMGLEEKNRISHRALAIADFVKHLDKLLATDY